MIDCRGSCSFCKDISPSISATHCQFSPIQQKELPSKQQSADAGGGHHPTVFPQREPLHRRRELCNHTKTDFFLVLIWWSYYQLAWNLGVLKTASPPKWPGFASLEVTRAMFSLYMPQGVPTRRGLSGSGH